MTATQIIGSTHIRLPQIGSTNQYALDMLAHTKPAEGTIISTPNQTAGKGQAANVWESEAGKNVSMSVILYPKFLQPREQFRLSQAVSLAIWDAVQDFVKEDVFIKWPNDIYIGEKKTCGLLIQNNINSNQILSSVIGIGLNVNQTQFSTKLPNPTSLSLELGKDLDLELVFEKLFEKLNQYYLQLRTRNFDLLNKAYHQRLFGFRQMRSFQTPDNQRFKGQIIGTSPFGKLLIETETGVREFDMKEVGFF